MAEPTADNVKDTFRINGVQLSKALKANGPTRKLNTLFFVERILPITL